MEDEVEDPRSGQRLVFRRVGGDVLELDLFISPGAFVREHVHPSQEERFSGVAGAFVLDVDGSMHTIRPGDTVVIPPRTPHSFEAAAEAAHLLVTVHPALQLDGYFRVFLGLSRAGRLRIPARGMPRPLLLFAVLMHRYRREIAVSRMPLWLQRPLWWLLARVGRLRGHRAAYPEYGAP